MFQETYDSVNADDPTMEITVRQQIIGGTSALWEQSVMPDKEYLHQVWIECEYSSIKALKRYINIDAFYLDAFNLYSAAVFASESVKASLRTGVNHLERQEKRATHLHLHTERQLYNTSGGQHVK